MTGPKTTIRPARGGARSFRGMTLLEVLLATVLLSMIAATVAGSVTAFHRAQQREAIRLGAMELANRLMLQYIDDPELMPSRMLAVEYGQHRYRWSIDESRADLRFVTGEETRRTGGLPLDRIRLVQIRVWLSEESGGSYMFNESVPNASINRLVDPFAFSNPDSTERRLSTDQGIRELLSEILQLDGGAGQGGGRGGQGRNPR